jgi:hypothetical protein
VALHKLSSLSNSFLLYFSQCILEQVDFTDLLLSKSDLENNLGDEQLSHNTYASLLSFEEFLIAVTH